MARPAAEKPWEAVRRAFDPLLERVASDERSQEMTRMMLQSPSMHASHAQKQSTWNGLIARALLPRITRVSGVVNAELRVDAVAAAARACLPAQFRWIEPSNTTLLPALHNATMGAVSGVVRNLE